MTRFAYFTFFYFLICSYSSLNAQIVPDDSSNVSWDWYSIIKQNGTEYVGQILSDDGKEILIYTRELGKIYLSKSELKSITKIDNPRDIVNGEYRSAGPFSTRYYFTTNAFPVKKGENYALIHLWGPEVHFSVSDNLNIGVMTTWTASPFTVAAKYSLKTKIPTLNFSLGSIVGTSGYLNSFRGFGGLYYGNITYGTRLSNVSFSAGFSHFQFGLNNQFYDVGYYTYSNDVWNFEPPYTYGRSKAKLASLFAISGITKIGAKASLIFDVITSFAKSPEQEITTGILVPDYYDPQSGQYTPGTSFKNVKNVYQRRSYLIVMPGLRFQSSDKKAFQFALAGITVFQNDEYYSFPIPMCSWFYKF